MCGHEQHGHHGRRRGFRGYPDREQWVGRLEAYQEHLEGELKKVAELLERLGPGPATTQSA